MRVFVMLHVIVHIYVPCWHILSIHVEQCILHVGTRGMPNINKILNCISITSLNSTTETAECCEGFTNRSGICESKLGLLFVCLGFIIPLENFLSNGDVTITGEGLQILTYARQSWTSSSEISFACHTFCDTGRPFIMVISEDPWHSHLLPSV